MPNPGVQSQFIAKSGGNLFGGEYYLDWYNNALQGSNIPDEYMAPGAFNGNPIRKGSNEIQGYYDTAIQAGGPIKRDKIWYFGTYRDQENQIEQPQFLFDQTFDTRLWNLVSKGTYQITPQHKLIGYYQWGQKVQPTRLPFATYNYTSIDPTNRQDSGSWVYKAEWNGTLSDKLYVEARYGDFGYWFPQITNGNQDFLFRDTQLLTVDGAHQRQQSDRDRKQLTSAATYFLDTTKGSHTLKVGGEVLLESQWSGSTQNVGGNRDLQYTNNRANQIIFYFPTAKQVGGLQDNDNGNILGQARLNVGGAFINDTWALGRLTLNGGVRWDRYRNWLPQQEQLAFSHGTPELSIPALTFPEETVNVWNSFAPRMGMVFDLTGDGRTVIKANYGLYWHNPGVTLSSNVNPNAASKSVTHLWTDINGDRRWQPGEEGTRTATNLAGTRTKDPNLKQPYTHEFGVFFERQLAEVIGSRVGFVYKTEDDLFDNFQAFRPPSAYTVPFQFNDIGPDGRTNTADDRMLTLYGVPSANAATLFPVNEVVMNTGELGRYKTVEASISKRYGNRWSAVIGGSYSIRDNYPADFTGASSFPNNPNAPGRYDRTTWDLKMTGSYDAPYGIRLSPVLRHQSGGNFAREISVGSAAAAAAGAIYSGTIYADLPEDNRRDNIWVFDVKAEKTFSFSDRMRLRAFVDFFNITNSHASETITVTTGPNYLRPTAILAPFTTRLGFRFLW